MATTVEAGSVAEKVAAAAAAAAPRRMTVAEFEEYPWGDNYQVELVHGEVVVSPIPFWAHAHVVRTLLLALHAHASSGGAGEVYGANTFYRLPHRDDTVRAADVSLVRAGRLPGVVPLRGATPFAPDLVVEVLSPSDTYSRVEEKLDDYLAAGVQLLWLVDPSRRRVDVVLPDGTRRRVGESETLDGAPVLPDFSITVGDIFAGVERE